MRIVACCHAMNSESFCILLCFAFFPQSDNSYVEVTLKA